MEISVKGTKFSRRKFLGAIAGGIITIIGMREYFKLLADLGIKHADRKSEIFLSKNGTPEQNVSKVVEMMGGIGEIIDSDSIVIIKPNCQWTGYGTTNTNAIKGFIDLVIAHPEGFTGEIIIAENVHASNYLLDGNISNRWDDEHRGFKTQDRNGDYNIYELVDHYHSNGFTNVSLYELYFLETRKSPFRPGKVVTGPEEGDGYVQTDIGYTCWENGRTTYMSYPIFTTMNGTKIDFRHGIWNNSHYSNTPIRFINFPVLKHHGQKDTGITCCIKNYLGIVDLSYFRDTNFHYMSVPGMYGAVGMFMKTVRMANLNIVDATWIRLRRTEPDLYSNTKTILAGTDPVALDYYAAKYILFPLSGNPSHNPDNRNQSFARQLREIWRQGVGILDEESMKIHSYDFSESNGQI